MCASYSVDVFNNTIYAVSQRNASSLNLCEYSLFSIIIVCMFLISIHIIQCMSVF